MPFRITNPNDLGQLNRAFSDQMQIMEGLVGELQKQVDNLRHQIKQVDVNHAPLTQNNITFTWTGATGTISWPAGSVKDKKGFNIPVKAGSIAGLPASTYHWLAWNPEHQQMIAQVGVDGLLQKPGNHVICQVFTGTGAQTGTVGGGGSSSNGSDLSGSRYKLF